MGSLTILNVYSSTDQSTVLRLWNYTLFQNIKQQALS